MKNLYTTLLLLLIAVANGQAQNWLDPQFGNAGLADAPIHTTDKGAVFFLDTAAGGKLTTFGWYENGSMHGDVVARYLSNGSLDASFGANGVYTLPADTVFSYGSVTAMRTQADSKIVLAGSYSNPWLQSGDDFFLVRLLADGSGLDPNFGNAGIVKTDFFGIPNNDDLLSDISFQPDGKIVAAGVSDSLFKTGVSIIRYNTNGTVDSSFGINGRVLHPIGNSYSVAKRLFVLPDSKILIAAQAFAPGSAITFTLVRLLPDGSPDMGFGNGGVVFTGSSTGGHGLLQDAVLQPDGKLLLTGGNPLHPGYFLVVRLLPDGSPDTSFNHTGTLNFPVPYGCRSTLLSLQPDGRIVVAGDNGNTSDDKWLAVRLLPGGSIDTTFGSNGIIESADLGFGVTHFLHDVYAQPDGKLVIGGQHYTSSTNRSRILARFLADNANSISEPGATGSCSLFPNPANEGVRYTLTKGLRPQSVRIYDAKGNQVSAEINWQTNYIATAHLPGGVYTVQIKADKHKIMTRKLVVVH